MHIHNGLTYKNPFIWTNDNTLPSLFCNDVIRKFNQDNRSVVGETMDGLNLDVKISLDLYITPLPEWKNEDEIFKNSLGENLLLYYQHLMNYYPRLSDLYYFANSEINDYGYQIQKTSPNGFYDWHNDARIEGNFIRILTFLWYLNDDYIGGKTKFYDGTEITPKTGRLLIFPATKTYVHMGQKVLSNEKYICTGWIYNKVI